MRIEVSVLAALLALSAPADQLLGTSGDLHILTSDTRTEKRWDRTFVTADAEGNISGDKGTVGNGAANAAVGALAQNISQIADAKHIAVTNAMSAVYATTNEMAQGSVGIVFHMAPSSTESNLCGYVVKTTSDGTNDTQYVWYSQDLTRPLVRYVKYRYYGGEETVKCNWVGSFTNTVSVTEGGRTWTKCHVCTVTRPSFAVDMPCVDKEPNEVFGGSRGFDLGSMPVLINGQPAFTGVITNKNNAARWIRVDGGFIKERSW